MIPVMLSASTKDHLPSDDDKPRTPRFEKELLIYLPPPFGKALRKWDKVYDFIVEYYGRTSGTGYGGPSSGEDRYQKQSGSEMAFIRLRSRNIEVVIFPKIYLSQYPVWVWIVRDHHGESGSER